jgi:hypothetical protein
LKQCTQIFFMAKARCFEFDRMLVIFAPADHARR